MTDPRIERHRIDHDTYDLLVVLSAKLEALDAYERFGSAHERGRALRSRVREADERQADLLVNALRGRLDAGAQPDDSMACGEPLARPKPPAEAGYAPDWPADRR